MQDPLWRLEKTRAAQTTLDTISVWMASRAAKSFADYDELHLCHFAGGMGDKGAPPYLIAHGLALSSSA